MPPAPAAAAKAAAVAASGSWLFGSTAWAWAFVGIGGAAATMSTKGAKEQGNWADEVQVEIDMRKQTQDMHALTTEKFDESANMYTDNLALTEEKELLIPEQTEETIQEADLPDESAILAATESSGGESTSSFGIASSKEDSEEKSGLFGISSSESDKDEEKKHIT